MADTLENINETTPLLLKQHQNTNGWSKCIKTWTLGLASISVSVLTAIPTAIINNWKSSKIFSFKNGFNNFIKNPLVWITPEITTTILTTLSYKANEQIVSDLFNKQISKISKFKSVIKNQIWSLLFLATNEIIKKMNERLVISPLIEIDFYDGLLETIGWNFAKEIVIVAIWEIYKVWKKDIQGINCHSVFVPVLVASSFVIGNVLQTVYLVNNNGEMLLDEFTIFFFYTFVENSVKGIFREVASSLLYYLFNNLSTNNANQSVIVPVSNNDSISEIDESNKSQYLTTPLNNADSQADNNNNNDSISEIDESNKSQYLTTPLNNADSQADSNSCINVIDESNKSQYLTTPLNNADSQADNNRCILKI